MKCKVAGFLRTGQLGSLALGHSMENVLRAVGRPPSWRGWRDTPLEKADWWAYGPCQFGWRDGRVVTMGVYMATMFFPIHETFEFEGLAPKSDLLLSEIVGFLSAEGIEFVFRKQGVDEVLVTMGHVLVPVCGRGSRRLAASMVRSEDLDREGITAWP